MSFNFRENLRVTLKVLRRRLEKEVKTWKWDEVKTENVYSNVIEFVNNYFKEEEPNIDFSIINSHDYWHGTAGLCTLTLKLKQDQIFFTTIEVHFHLEYPENTNIEVEVYSPEEFESYRKHLLEQLESENAEKFVGGVLISSNYLSEPLF